MTGRPVFDIFAGFVKGLPNKRDRFKQGEGEGPKR